jgi:CRISPR-associated protein Csx17
VTEHLLRGLRSTPLASYLAGLGLTRLLGEQADPDLTAMWTDDGLVIDTTVEDIASWLADRYVPTPVLSPWNEGSGFGTKDVTPKQALAALAATTSARLRGLREAIPVATGVGKRYRERLGAGAKKDAAKESAVRDLRNRCPEALLPWIDAAVVLGDQAYFPPLLGTGGNDGRLDFSTTFHQRLLEVLDPAPKAHQRAAAQAKDLLMGTQVEGLHPEAVGQFDPAGGGGKNSSPFGDAASLVNPWAYLLLIEGALLFAASAARRQLHGAGRAAMPFTVFASPDGSDSGADGESSRGEVWAPVWNRPFTLPEIRQLFAEARASWRGRPAQQAVDFYAATRTLGVARGVAAFERYGLHQRNGLAFVAVPIERVEVGGKPEVRLAAALEEWVSRVRRGESSTAVGRAVRRFDNAYLAFAREGQALPLARLLAALTDLEQAVGRSGRARGDVRVRVPPRAGDFLDVLRREECAELRVAVGIASCATLRRPGTAGEAPRTMRQLLLPVDPDGRWREAPLVPGFGARPLRQVLAEVLTWRSRTAADEADATAFRGVPTFRSGIPVPAADLHMFAAPGRLDEQRLDLWLRACLALRWDGARHHWAARDAAVPVPTLGLLHPLAAGLAPAGAEPGTPRLALNPDWAARLVAGQVVGVHADAVRRLRQAGWRAVPEPARATVDGAAIAAALVPRCRGSMAVLTPRLAVPLLRRDDDTDAADDSDVTEQLVEEMS